MGGRNNYVRLRRWCSTLTRRVVAGGTRRENAGQGIRSRAGEGAIERTGTQKRQSREVLQCCEIRPASGWPSLELTEVWRHLELIYLLIVRDTKVRYKQSLVGIGWALLQPLLTVVVFTVLFDHLVKVPTEGVPYPIFALTALVPWTYFIHALTKTTVCLVTNTALITRVYFPRLVLPISAVLAGLVDFVISFGLLLIMLVVYGIRPTATVVVLPFFLLLGILAAFSCGLWLSALNVQYRDVVNALPFFTQMMFLVTPVAYSNQLIPAEWRYLYALNPMASVVTGFRWVLLGNAPAPGLPCLVSVAVVLAALVGGLYFFRYQEERFADAV